MRAMEHDKFITGSYRVYLEKLCKISRRILRAWLLRCVQELCKICVHCIPHFSWVFTNMNLSFELSKRDSFSYGLVDGMCAAAVSKRSCRKGMHMRSFSRVRRLAHRHSSRRTIRLVVKSLFTFGRQSVKQGCNGWVICALSSSTDRVSHVSAMAGPKEFPTPNTEGDKFKFNHSRAIRKWMIFIRQILYNASNRYAPRIPF